MLGLVQEESMCADRCGAQTDVFNNIVFNSFMVKLSTDETTSKKIFRYKSDFIRSQVIVM